MNKMMSLVIIFVSLSISTNLVLAQANLSKDTSQDTIAQKAYLEPESLSPIKVKFARGSYKAKVKGYIEPFTIQPYIISSKDNQLFRVQVFPEGVEASIYFVKGNSKKYLGSVSGGVWSGVVPQTGDMVLEILARGETGYSYTAEFTVR
jgi:hypothetical protein